MNWLRLLLARIFASWEKKSVEDEVPVIPPPVPPVVPVVEPPPKYLWDTIANAKHSVRVICDEEKLSWKDKNDLCGTVGAESGWQSYYLTDVYRKGVLFRKKGDPVKLENIKNGIVWSTDWGIAQINDWYHIGVGKSFSSHQYVLDNPEACIRWMCKQWKAGNAHWWIAFKNKSYLAYV